MGKLKGILKITGQFDGLSFYEMNGKIIVRKTGGFDGKAIKSKANYARTRENAAEFGLASGIGKQLRLVLHPFLKRMHSSYLQHHVLKKMLEIMRCDTVSERGKRTVGKGLQTEEGQKLLAGFELNKAVPLSLMIGCKPELSLAEGQLVFEGMTAEAVRFPEYATHIGLRAMVLWFDAEQESFVLVPGDRWVLAKTGFDVSPVLAVNATDGVGVPIVLLFAEFLQEVNGELLELEGCSLTVCCL